MVDAVSPYLSDVSGLWLYLIGPLDPAAARFKSARRHSFDAPWLELAGPREGAAIGAAATMAGAPLDALIATLLAAPLAGTPLRALRAERELAWRAAGAELWRANEQMISGSGAEGRALGRRTLEALPAPLRDAVLSGVHR